jgi:hypothetical protein
MTDNKPKWQSIETAPTDGTAIIVVTEAAEVGRAEYISFEDEEGWWWVRKQTNYLLEDDDWPPTELVAKPTHWIALQSPHDRTAIYIQQPYFV